MKRLIKSFSYALKGIKSAHSSEPNMQIHIVVAILVVATGFFFGISSTEWVLLTLCFALVISAEMINTSLEKLTDLVSPEKNPEAGKVKDIAAGAVLVATIFSVIIGLIIFLPKFIVLFSL